MNDETRAERAERAETRATIVADIGEDRMKRIEAIYEGLNAERVDPWMAIMRSPDEIDSYYFIEAQWLEWLEHEGETE